MAESMLHLDALCVRYGSRVVLDGLSLAPVEPGTTIGLLGPNGVGKSTLLRALARLASATGRATFGSLDLLCGSRREHTRQVGYLPQTLPQPSSLLVYEAVRSALRATCGGLSDATHDRRLQQVFTRLRLHPLAMSSLDRLSGGQRQMVGLAQVLVRDTPLLLLDEPTSALDLRWQLLALEAVGEAARRRGAIVLVAMHDLNLASRFCDRLVLLSADGLVADGAPADVLTPPNLRRAYRVDARVERTASGDYVALAERAIPDEPALACDD
ncbi:ABC transporter ATP-binding protein [Burkholderia cepacia]|uniref:ABC transporter ATP-binding protein n=1 Tax=Burkholderia cepacia TaxID=292 RepID=A0A2S8IHD5_BURCE|nr:ABC transporter ATP-binding protein [Burkholderia cepacia]PQP14196.1 ABC transporter ATP-binding protein [Burkholderia cepacia]HDR9509969.1 ABC transporter ATP-binding protein [Burkholderia cepacia]